MSFYTALTGLNGAQSDISATSNNIANVNTTGFKRSRAEFGDIFATSPLQNASSSIGSGTILKSVKQQFTQGNITSSLNVLDIAISGQGFFSLKPSLTSGQTVYTRNGSFNVNNDRYVTDSSGQFLLTFPVNEDGSVTAKDLVSAVPLQLPVTSGTPKATTSIELGVNVSATSEIITDKPQFENGYVFDPNDPTTYNNSTSITIFDDLGNPTIATIFFIRTQAASAADPTNKFETRLVINDTVIDPDLVRSVTDTQQPIFIDRFGQQTTKVPDDNYFLEGKGSALYKLDDLQTLVDSTPAKVTGESSAFDFGEEGDKTVTIVTDPMKFNSTRESGDTSSSIYWGTNFMTINVDNSDQPVNIDIRPGSYNATQLSAEIQRAVNAAYGDDKKIQIVQNVDDTLTIDLLKLNADGTSTGLTTPVSVDLLSDSYVSDLEGIVLTGASPDFTREQFLAHTQARLNAALNEYAVTPSTDAVNSATALGVSESLFYRASGKQISTVLNQSQAFTFNHRTADNGSSVTSNTAANLTANGSLSTGRHLTYSYYGKTPALHVYDEMDSLGDNASTTAVSYDQSENTVRFYFGTSDPALTANEKVRFVGKFYSDTTQNANSDFVNGREFTIASIGSETVGGNTYYYVEASTAGMSFPDSDFTLSVADANDQANIYSEQSTAVEAFFEGADNVYSGAPVNFSSSKIVVREIGSTTKHDYTNADMVTKTTAEGAAKNIIDDLVEVFTLTDTETSAGTTLDTYELTGLGENTNTASRDEYLNGDGTTTDKTKPATHWVDEKDPPIEVTYDVLNQRLQFEVDRNLIGTGTNSNFNSFKIYGASTATAENNLGIPTADDTTETLIRGGEKFSASTFVADGAEIQLNDKRFGVKVGYNSELKAFEFSSGTTGETIAANGAIGVTEAQTASSIVVGRYLLSTTNGSVTDATDFFSGDNNLLGIGVTKTNAITTDAKGLAAQPAQAIGASATEDLTQVFRLSNLGNENVFNVSVNGVAGVIEIPQGFYVGTTLAEALQQRINQIEDSSGTVGGGITVKYNSANNNFTFTNGTTGRESTIKVRGASKFGLDNVDLGVGSVPQIYNLKQATNSEGLNLFVDANGNKVTTPPANLVDGYFPLYIDEGELTFDKSGAIVSPKQGVHYEKQEAGFSIDLDIDFTKSTQLAQPFFVSTVNQDGFTSGRLDGLEVDASGTVRANYTNGQNNPLGKIVLANFNNQNGLKQIGNATYVETAVSGTATVGEAGAEGFGTVLSGSLERSNVDITEELVNLITAQRNFQANAKSIETTAATTQAIVNIRM
ncbi:MAG: flagellar hook-basal body protein [alpha proteobacterium MED-G10]|nr:MAG: flagellar hook-basal body protein [alpha proteobacterium MED-G10]